MNDITKISIIHSSQTEPYYNLALEEHLMQIVKEGEVILYLWQNKHTVVIGKNQNAYTECNINTLEKDGGSLARRSSGGGAVYHDLGNLNFTFIALKEWYDVAKQMKVVLKAMELLGLHAELSGRNDITIEGKKFSGNAFSHHGRCSCHHGTLMLHVNTDYLTRYLNVSAAKLQSKGVSSVKSRVCNLCEYKSDLTVEELSSCLSHAFGMIYEYQPENIPVNRIDKDHVYSIREQYASDDWRLGKQTEYSFEVSNRFSFGEITFQFLMERNQIQSVYIYSDALDTDFIEQLKTSMKDCKNISLTSIMNCLNRIKTDREEMTEELSKWVRHRLKYSQWNEQ